MGINQNSPRGSRPCDVALKMLLKDENHGIVDLFIAVPARPNHERSIKEVGFICIDSDFLVTLTDDACNNEPSSGSKNLRTSFPDSEKFPFGARDDWEINLSTDYFCLGEYKDIAIGVSTQKFQFTEIAKALSRDPDETIVSSELPVCRRFGGALVYADEGMDGLIEHVSAEFPEHAARQREIDMRNRIGQASIAACERPSVTPRRTRLKL